MLEIPYEVKRALRMGRYRKNYKFDIYAVNNSEAYENIGTFWNGDSFVVAKANNYRFPPSTYGYQLGANPSIDIPASDDYSEVYVPKGSYAFWIWDNAQHTQPSPNLSTELYKLRRSRTHEYSFRIDNDTLIKESVSIDERMDSGTELKFGLCEGSSLEFQYFNHPNIRNCDICAWVSIEYKNSQGVKQWYDIPMGWYTVQECPRQFSTGIYKVTAYNKLKSAYLDEKANDNLADAFTSDATLTIYDIKKTLLEGYQINASRVGVNAIPPLSIIQNEYVFMTTAEYKYQYGIDTPINPHNVNASQIQLDVMNSVIPLYTGGVTQHYVGVEAVYGTLVGLERNVVNYIRNLVVNAHVNHLGGNREVLWGDVLNAICGKSQTLPNYVTGFERIFGVQYNGSFYSTIQWDWEEAHGVTHTVAGTIADVQNRLLLAGGSYIPALYIPDIFILHDASQSPYGNGALAIMYTGYGYFPLVSSDTSRTYEYWEDSSHTIATGEYEILKYSDGTLFEDNGHGYQKEYMFSFYEYPHLSQAEYLTFKISEMPDFTLREIVSGVFETVCQYGKLDRETDLFSGVELNDGGLYPADTLYPATGLYPQGNSVHPFPSEYQKLWTDTVGEQRFRYLRITYKTTETVSGQTQEVEKIMQKTVNNDGTTDYNMSDNWLFKNMVWTEAKVGQYADAMVEKMKPIRWFPFEMWCVGLPHIETGDAIEITDKEGDTYLSYILQRQLKGIHGLQDTFINGKLDIF